MSCYSKAQTALKKKKKEMYHELHSFFNDFSPGKQW